jgi:shikimate kinase
MKDDIILIGPIGSGKTTIAALLSEALDLPVVSLDVLRWDYYAEIGYDPQQAKLLMELDGFRAMYDYWKPFEIHAVERVLADHSDCIIEFGGGHSVYEDDTMFARAKHALTPYRNLVLLLPSPDNNESFRILSERLEEAIDLNRHFIEHHSNDDLATITVYTDGKTPETTRDEIIARLNH